MNKQTPFTPCFAWTMATSTLLVLVGLVAVVVAKYEVAFIKPCKDVPQDACTVTEVRIDPCTTHKRNLCKLTKGEAAHMEFDFIPTFNATSLKTGVFYDGIRFPDMADDDACKLTTCPTVGGQSQKFKYDLYLGTKLPKGIFPMNWKVWNADNSEQVCCFVTSVQLVKGKK